MKLIGAILLALSCTAAGAYSVLAGRRRVAALESLKNYMATVKTGIRVTRADLDRVLLEAAPALHPQDAAVLEGEPLYRIFLAGLGTGPLEQQLEHCDACLEAASRLFKEADEKQKKNAKVTLTLYSLGGLAIAILLY
ncbi:MAG TPA: stage III sporulation protein AB [Candidatus Acidoferrum sp.]|nr:stage III sporulation protein AB [Candidatus Acidoferrum sp.]